MEAGLRRRRSWQKLSRPMEIELMKIGVKIAHIELGMERDKEKKQKHQKQRNKIYAES